MRQQTISAMMDVSDGLLIDCWRMAQASRVTFALDGEAIPVADPARRDACIRWGDDYELLFTAPPAAVLPVEAHAIGRVIQPGASPLQLDGAILTDPAGLGYQHG
jgi:thiamine-monophosphate kinase